MVRWLIASTVVTLAIVCGYWYGTLGSEEGIQSMQVTDATSDGIKVHGEWEVTVSDPDGSNQTVYNFQNSLLPGANNALLQLLIPYDNYDAWPSPKKTADYLMILASEAPVDESGTSTYSIMPPEDRLCLISRQYGPSYSDMHDQPISWVLKIDSNNKAEYLSISGGCQIPYFNDTEKDVFIKYVFTSIGLIGADYDSPFGAGTYAGYSPFTGRYLDEPIPVSPNQMVAVTVNVSFH